MKKVYSKIESINGSVITVKAEDVSYGELAQVQTSFGSKVIESWGWFPPYRSCGIQNL